MVPLFEAERHQLTSQPVQKDMALCDAANAGQALLQEAGTLVGLL